MRLLRIVLTIIFPIAIGCARANEEAINEQVENQQRCAGMYSRSASMGHSTIDPYIQLSFLPGAAGQAAAVMFEWNDLKNIGKLNQKTGEINYLCDDEAIANGLCNSTHIGQFIINTPSGETNGTSIYSVALSFQQNNNNSNEINNEINNDGIEINDGTHPIKYLVNKTGYYCVSIVPTGKSAWTTHFDGVVVYRNAYGELSAADYPKLLFYGGLSIIYLIISCFWLVVCGLRWKELLPIQNYLSGIIIFTTIEMGFSWGYYDYMNIHGSNNISHALLGWVSILNAARNSLSFFILLIVCMGYGVVVESLGPTMWKCRFLALAHFVFGVAYSIGATLMPPEEAGLVVLFVIFPLAFTMTAFYVWTLSSLQHTIQDLGKRRQTVKMTMYKRLYRLLLFSVIMLGIFFIFNSVTFSGGLDPSWAARNWQKRWFLIDGWLNLVYLIVLSTIAYLWRPTSNNRRFAMSDEIAQDDLDDFELGNRHNGSGSEDEDDSLSGIKSNNRYVDDNRYANGDHHGVHDDSLVFEIGDEDHDDENDDTKSVDDVERQGLTKKHH